MSEIETFDEKAKAEGTSGASMVVDFNLMAVDSLPRITQLDFSRAFCKYTTYMIAA